MFRPTILLPSSGIFSNVSKTILLQELTFLYLKKSLKMEAKILVETFILVPEVVNRWRGYSLFESVVPNFVNRWHGHSLLKSVVPNLLNRWRWHSLSFSAIVKRCFVQHPLLVSKFLCNVLTPKF